MQQAPSKAGDKLPPWLVCVGTVAIVLHLIAVVLPILIAQSGPWPTTTGRSMEDPPRFAQAARGLSSWHTRYLRFGQNFHHLLDRPADLPGVELEILLRNDKDELIQTLHLPDPNANPWVRHRQELLVRSLAPDLPVDPPGQELIAAPGKNLPDQTIWTLPEERFGEGKTEQKVAGQSEKPIQLILREVPPHLVPRTRSVMRPSELSLALVHSYARYLCREYGAASADVLRHTREPIAPAILFEVEPGATIEELVASYGKVSP
jgi:hypothetical protein